METKWDGRADLLSRLTTLICSLYVAWIAYRLGTWVGAFGPLFSGLGAQPPRVTLFVVGLSKSVLLVAGTLLVGGLVAKEVLITSAAVRQTVTFIVFMSVDWFAAFCMDALLKPIVEILHKIG